MKVFVTGANGYLGAAVVQQLLSDGHEVSGLVRSEATAAKLKDMGVEPVLGSVTDIDVLSEAAAAADAVIHTAFGHHGDYFQAIKDDRAAVRAMTDALAGPHSKPFVMSSATGFMGNTGPHPVSEEFVVDVEHPLAARCLPERDTLQAEGKGVRAMAMRLPPYVWGNGGSAFIPVQIETAKKNGKAYFILPGDQRVCSVHVDDAARAYVLALQHGKTGVYNITSSNDATVRGIAEACGANAGVPAEGVSLEDAYAKEIWPAWMCSVFGINNCASGAKATRELKWADEGKRTGMLKDIASGSYKQ